MSIWIIKFYRNRLQQQLVILIFHPDDFPVIELNWWVYSESKRNKTQETFRAEISITFDLL